MGIPLLPAQRFGEEETCGRKSGMVRRPCHNRRGRPCSLEAPRQGEGWIRLDWKAPAAGGAVTVYKLQRRERPEGAWQDISLAMETNTTLLNQQRGKECEYRVIAVNKAGESAPINTVMAVL